MMEAFRPLSSALLEDFHNASSFVSKLDSSPQLAPLTTAEKLRFYALFKLVTTSGSGPGQSPSFWDFEGKAKADSWTCTKLELENIVKDGSRSKIAELAALQYIEKARELGWLGGSPQRVSHVMDRQDTVPADAQQGDLVAELSKFFAEEGLDVLHQDFNNESDDGGSVQSGSTQSGRDEFGFPVDDFKELGLTGCAREFRHAGQQQPTFNMASVSKMLDASGPGSHSPDEPPSIHDLIIDNNETVVRRYLSHLLETDGKSQLERILNNYNTNGYTPLHLASDRGSLSIVQLLIDSGSDPSLRDKHDHLTARELAGEAGMTAVEDYLAQLELQA